MLKLVYKELTVEDLRNVCDPAVLGFETTKELESLDGIIGQGRAAAAMEFGLAIKRTGYNIYVAGMTGTGRSSYTRSIINKIAQHEKTPEDWCYVYNFKTPDKPIAINLPSGTGSKLEKDMKRLLKNLKAKIPKAFEGEEYEKQKNDIIQLYQDKSTQLMEDFNLFAKEKGFVIKKSEQGIMTIPMIGDKPIEEDEFLKLETEERKRIEEDSFVVQTRLLDTMKQIKEIEKSVREKLEQLEAKIALTTVEQPIMELKDRYSLYKNVVEYLQSVQKDIIHNIDDFREINKAVDEGALFPDRIANRDHTKKYQINLIVDRRDTVGAPVVFEANPKYHNLFGKIEYESNMGVVTTDFSKIKSGSIHAANGGYIIINMADLMHNPESWEGIKRAIKTNSITIENIYSIPGIVSGGMKPQPIPLNIKIVLIGSAQLYQMLYNYDEDFRKLFKIKADFDIDMSSADENIIKYAKFISSHCEKKELMHFDNTGVAAVVEYSRRLAEHKHKLSTRFNDIVEILIEADAWARIEGAGTVTAYYVKKAIKEKYYRSNRIEEKLQEFIDTGVILISTEDRVIGQVNGLSVMEFGDISFGKPSRITAVTYAGEKGIVNIEREVEMSGSIHDKGVLILSGYLGEKFAQEFPLSLSASVCFEQLYDGVEGDSASSTELYALLSSLAEVPVKQSIAVTGSVNQKGEIQPIGGVNEKIEGFFQTCKARGLKGNEGVMIPHQNVVNLMLNDEVVEAVKRGSFHIYAIRDVEEGIALLTDMPAGCKNEKGEYPEESIFYKVQKKLEKYARIMEDIEDQEE
ncbi:MAG TPA: ATP-binding protein [Patescibacteria group bacterium]|nr:ATP-binding protein [Patescibacteria group bacterium]